MSSIMTSPEAALTDWVVPSGDHGRNYKALSLTQSMFWAVPEIATSLTW